MLSMNILRLLSILTMIILQVMDDSTLLLSTLITIILKRGVVAVQYHVDFSQYDSFIFDLSNDQFPPADRSDFNHEEFTDELTHIMPLPELECFKFKIEPDPGDLTSIDLGIRKNVSTTNVNDFPDCEDSRARSIYKSFTSSASFWKSSIQI
ncbi:hypothetical protein Tco_1146948 [Tanacetum coccineum]